MYYVLFYLLNCQAFHSNVKIVAQSLRFSLIIFLHFKKNAVISLLAELLIFFKKETRSCNKNPFFVHLTRVFVDGEKLLPFEHAVHHACTATVRGIVGVRRGNLHNGCACWRKTAKCQTREYQSENGEPAGTQLHRQREALRCPSASGAIKKTPWVKQKNRKDVLITSHCCLHV